jgi:hypothetical protein
MSIVAHFFPDLSDGAKQVAILGRMLTISNSSGEALVHVSNSQKQPKSDSWHKAVSGSFENIQSTYATAWKGGWVD